MRILLLSACLGALVGGTKLETVYTAEKALQVEITFQQENETSTTMERDGEPVEGTGGGMGISSAMTYTEVFVDRYLAVDAGKPTKVRRSWSEVSGKTSMSMGDQGSEREMESPFEGLEIEIEADAESAKVIAGTEPEGEGSLTGHQLMLCLDGLLPNKDVAVDDTWELSKEAILTSLRQDLLQKMIRPPVRTEGGGERRGQRGGRGGARGGRGLMDFEWEGSAKVVSLEEDVDGVACTVVDLTMTASGTRDLPQGGRSRDGMLGLPAENTMTYKVELEGKLYYDNTAKRPLKMDVKGTANMETVREMTREESTMRIESSEDGKIEYTIAISEAKEEAKKE